MPDSRPPGRPPLPDALRRDVRVSVRLTAREYAALAATARARRQTLAAWMRQRFGLRD